MSRPLSAEREREFQELFAFVDFYMTHVSKVETTSERNMSTFCTNIIRQYGKSKALDGLRQATNDIIEELSDRPIAGIAVLDEALRAHGILTASEARRRYASSYRRIVKRGSVRDDTEYYLLNGIVVDLGNGLADDERAVLQRLLDGYAAKQQPER
jgi:hypothetical protein